MATFFARIGGPSWRSAAALVSRLCQFPWFGGWLLIVNAITKWLRSYNESVVFGEIAHAPRHTSVMQRRRSPPTNTQLHNMQRLSSVQLLGGPNKLHFPNRARTPCFRAFTSQNIPGPLATSHSPRRVDQWREVACESLGTCSDGGKQTYVVQQLFASTSRFPILPYGGGGRWPGCWRRPCPHVDELSGVIARVASKEELDKSCICASWLGQDVNLHKRP